MYDESIDKYRSYDADFLCCLFDRDRLRVRVCVSVSGCPPSAQDNDDVLTTLWI